MNNEQLKQLKETIAENEVNTNDVNNSNNTIKNNGYKSSSLFDSKWAKRVPEHIRNLVYILRNNTEIRRYTAVGILNYLMQKEEIKGEKRYVEFLWNKFRVKVNGITREYLYTEPFFLNCFVASFASFSNSAQKTINAFCKAEMSVTLDKAVDENEVNDIVKSNEIHQEEQELNN